MGIISWDSGFNTAPVVRTPRLTIRCEYPDTDLPPTEVTFRLSPSYGLLTAREAHDWFLQMMHDHEEFEVETDRVGDWPMPFCSETVKQVVVE
jgi:hypothetical protein